MMDVRGKAWNNLVSSIILHELLAQIPVRTLAVWLKMEWVLFFLGPFFKHLLRGFQTCPVANIAQNSFENLRICQMG